MSALSEKITLAFERMFKSLGTMTNEEAATIAARLDKMIQWYATLEKEEDDGQ